MPVSEARQQLAPLIARVRAEREPVFLTRRGRRIAAIIGADELDELIRLASRPPDGQATGRGHARMRPTG